MKLYNSIIRNLFVITLILFCSAQLIAAPEDHGRWYSVDDSGSSSHSPAFYVFCFIIGAICAGFLIVTTLNDDKHSNSDKGCITTFLLVLLFLGFLAVMKACN
jgi:hypothetical protein